MTANSLQDCVTSFKMDDLRSQLIAVEAKLAKDPDDEELQSLKRDLLEAIELLEEEEAEEEKEKRGYLEESNEEKTSSIQTKTTSRTHSANVPSSSTQSGCRSDDLRRSDDNGRSASCLDYDSAAAPGVDQTITSGGAKRKLSEAELLAKKRDKDRKKKAKLREKHRQELAVAESDKQSWQSFAQTKGLKGMSKKSIFASPYSLTGKVGVGTNGIADRGAASASLVVGGASSSSSSGSSRTSSSSHQYSSATSSNLTSSTTSRNNNINYNH